MQTGNGTEVAECGSELARFAIESVDHDLLNQVQSMTGVVVDIQGNEGIIETEHTIRLTIDTEIRMTDAITGSLLPLDQMLIVIHPGLLRNDDRFRLHTLHVTAVRHLPSE